MMHTTILVVRKAEININTRQQRRPTDFVESKLTMNADWIAATYNVGTLENPIDRAESQRPLYLHQRHQSIAGDEFVKKKSLIDIR